MRNKWKRILCCVLSSAMMISVLPSAAVHAAKTVVGGMTTISSTTAGGSNRATVLYGNYAYSMVSTSPYASIQIFDVSDLSNIQKVTPADNADLVGPVAAAVTDGKGIIDVIDGYLYAGFDSHIRKYSLETPDNPVLVGTFGDVYKAGKGQMTVFGKWLLATSDGKTAAYDMTNQSATTKVAASRTFSNSRAPVTSDKNYVYISGAGSAGQSTIYAIDANTYAPNTWNDTAIHANVVPIATVSGAVFPDYRSKLQRNGNYLYFSDGTNHKVYRVDLSNGISENMTVQTLYEGTALADYLADGDMLYIHTGAAREILTYAVGADGKVTAKETISTQGQTNTGCIRFGMTEDYLYFNDNYSINIFRVKDYKLKMTSDSTITSLPFSITGTVLSNCGLTLSLKDTASEQVYSLTPSVSGESWKVSLADIYPGSYTLTAKVSDEGTEVLSEDYELTVSLSGYGETPSSVNKTLNDSDASAVTLAPVAIDYESDTVSVTGKIPMKTRIGYKEVGLKIADPSGTGIYNEKQRSLGNFDFSVSLNNPQPNKDYSITLSCEGETDVVKTFRYYGTTFINNAVGTINGAESAEKVGKLLFANAAEGGAEDGPYAEALGIDGGVDSDYAALINKTAVLSALVGQNFANETAVKTAFDTAVAKQKKKEAAVAEIDKATSADAVKKLIAGDAEAEDEAKKEGYASLLGISLTTEPYTEMKESAQTSLFQDVVNFSGKLTEEGLLNIFSEDYCLLRYINTCGSSEIGAALVKYQTKLDLSSSLVKKYTETLIDDVVSEVNKELARIEESEYFTSFAAVKTLFESTVTDAENPQKGGGSSSSSSNKGSGKNPGGGVLGGTSATLPSQDSETTNNAVFKDLGTVSWAEKAITYLYEKGIINGKAEGEFAPNDSLTREEFIKMLVLATGTELSNAEIHFADVGANAWYYAYVATAYELGIVNGMSETEFGIGEVLSREQMAVMLDRFLSYLQIATEQKNELAFADEISDYAKESVQRLVGAGIMNGTGDGIFDAHMSASRAMGAKVLYELILLSEGR